MSNAIKPWTCSVKELMIELIELNEKGLGDFKVIAEDYSYINNIDVNYKEHLIELGFYKANLDKIGYE